MVSWTGGINKMIKFDTSENNNNPALVIKGDLCDLVGESLAMMRCIYNVIKKDDEMMAEKYKKLIIANFEACFISKEELDKLTKKAEEELENQFNMILEAFGVLAKKYKGDSKEAVKDIRSADFDSDEAFMNWLHNMNDKEE